MQNDDNPMAAAPSGMVLIGDVPALVRRHWGIPQNDAANVLRPAIEDGNISYQIWGTEADRRSATWEDRVPLYGPYILPHNVDKWGGWGCVDWNSSTIEGREIRVRWSDLQQFVDLNRWRFELREALGAGRDAPAIRPPVPTSVAAQTACQKWLAAIMKISPQRPRTNKDLLVEAHTKFMHLSDTAFKRAKKDAIKETGATAWGEPGRKTVR